MHGQPNVIMLLSFLPTLYFPGIFPYGFHRGEILTFASQLLLSLPQTLYFRGIFPYGFHRGEILPFASHHNHSFTHPQPLCSIDTGALFHHSQYPQ
jgi:hypothetical protein